MPSLQEVLPEPLRALFQAQPKIMIEALFAQSAGALADVAALPKNFGGKLGMIGVLHTWSRQLIYHPHIHYVVPAIALSPQGGLKAPADPKYLLPLNILKSRYRSRMRDYLFGEHPQLAAQVPQGVWRKGWNIHILAVGRGREALAYLGRYVFKTPLSSQHILSHQNGQVCFSYRESGSGRRCLMKLSAFEFIRRFLQHVLPRGLHRVRTYGWLSPAARKSFERICALLDALEACEPAAPPEPPVVLCPHCGRAMRLLRVLARGPPSV